MARENGGKWTTADIPFRVDRAQAGSLTKQLTDGIREAIASGRFRPGLILPSILEWSRLFNISIHVPEAAIAVLAREGLITPRKHLGCVVNPRRRNVWNGRVLVIVPGGDHVYSRNVLLGRVRAKVAEAGYLFTHVTVPEKDNGRYDCRQLAHELKSQPDFTLLIFDLPQISRLLSKSGVPFGVIGRDECRLSGCAVTFRIDCGPAIAALVEHCRRAGVKHVIQVSKETDRFFDAVPALREAGIEAGELLTPFLYEYGRPEGVARGAMEAFAARLAEERRGWLPELLVFTDDHVASGALLSLVSAGVRIPEDIRIVSLSNKGSGPVFPVSLARIENDPYQNGDIIANSILAFLTGRRMRVRDMVPRYIGGDSFP